jgi:hypothetical protein
LGIPNAFSRGAWECFQYVTRLAPASWKEKYNQGSFKEEILAVILVSNDFFLQTPCEKL